MSIFRSVLDRWRSHRIQELLGLKIRYLHEEYMKKERNTCIQSLVSFTVSR